MVRPFGKLRTHHQRILLDFAIVLEAEPAQSLVYSIAAFLTPQTMAAGAVPGTTSSPDSGAGAWVGQLYNLVVVNTNGNATLADTAGRLGMSCRVEGSSDLLWDGDQPETPDAVLLDLASLEITDARRAVGQCRERKVPVLAAVPREQADTYDPALNPDEVMLCPLADEEFSLRVRQAVFRVKGPSGSQTLSIGDLRIDLERYEVSVAGRRVTLTYKEFQLLALLASNPGRVYTREALLSQVWGYDYLGGTRTVDVHVRRLRSKVESPGRSFVETIWNVGYRFKAPG